MNQSQVKPEKNPVVTITMGDGNIIKAELYPEIAPNTVNNFIYLINKGYYTNSNFHRIVKNFVLQGGISPDSPNGPGYSIKGEFSSNGFKNELKHTTGVLSMARTSVKDSASSQFFIMVNDSPHLDGEYAAFGKVTEGLDYAKSLQNVPCNGDSPVNPPVIASITVDTFGQEYPEPEMIK